MSEQTVMGFDFGRKRIGIAIGQTLTNTAHPLAQIKSVDWQKLEELVTEWQPHAFVVGLPLHMDATKSPLSKAAKQFAKQLRDKFDKPTHMFDERLSSREALERLRDRGKTKASKAEINSMAAVVIVEGWLNNNPC